MNTRVRQAHPDDAPAISDLVQAGFVKHVAPDWESSAINGFLRDTTSEKLAPILAEAALVLVCEGQDQMLGVIALPKPQVVQLFFVAPSHIRSGIGRTLWEAARKQLEERYAEVRTVELNSSPCAVPVYEALGFFPISKQFRRKGSVATRMACWLPGRALEEAHHVA
jgi:GNAT superfamily N-acetyltransferase